MLAYKFSTFVLCLVILPEIRCMTKPEIEAFKGLDFCDSESPNAAGLQSRLCQAVDLKNSIVISTGESPSCENKTIHLDDGQQVEVSLLDCGLKLKDEEGYLFFGRGEKHRDAYLYACAEHHTTTVCEPMKNLPRLVPTL